MNGHRILDWCGASFVTALVCLLIYFFTLPSEESSPWKTGDFCASGLFYYGPTGLENSSQIYWSGPSPMYCFKRFVWDERGADFGRLVRERLQRLRGANVSDDEWPAVQAAMDTVVFERVTNSMRWAKMTMTSPDATTAVEAVNAVLQALEVKDGENRYLRWLTHFGGMAEQQMSHKIALAGMADEKEREDRQLTIDAIEQEMKRMMANRDERDRFKAMEIPTNAIERVDARKRRKLLDSRSSFEKYGR